MMMDAQDVSNGEALVGVAAGRVVGTLSALQSPHFQAQQEAMHKQQLMALNRHAAGQDRLLRLEVLKLASANRPGGDIVSHAEEFWTFVTSGDPT
jgi:hypothetical protein